MSAKRAPAPRVQWSRQLEEKLVELWREHECLFVVSSASYHDRGMRESSWNAIASAIELPVSEVQMRAASLRTQYGKLLKPKPSGSGDKNPTPRQTWILTHLEFLKPYVVHRHAETSLTLSSSTEDPPETPLDDEEEGQIDAGPERELDMENEESSVASAVQSPHISPMSSRPGTPLTPLSSTPLFVERSSTPVNINKPTTEEETQTRVLGPQRQGKRKGSSEGSVELQKLAILKQMSSAFKPQDDEESFGKQVASELRQIKDRTIKLRAKRNIMVVLYDAQEAENTRGFAPSYASGGPAASQHRVHEPMYGHPTPIPVPHPSYMRPLQGYAPTPTHTQTQSFMGMLADENETS